MRGLAALLFLSCATLACGARTSADSLETEIVDAGFIPPPDGGPTPPSVSNKLDLLLVVDNSRFMDQAQLLLSQTLPYLLERLTSPKCVNGLGNVVSEAAPPAACPVGEREFAPLRDIHVGVISTSLGGHGADVCSPDSPGYDPTTDEHAHLSQRAKGGGVVDTYQDQGFLAWDPAQQKSPPGDSSIDYFTTRARSLVEGLGTKGCGFESQLESIYRFLVDPTPYATIGVQDGIVRAEGIDDLLLAQRDDFLRPDSAVAIVLLSDENDCSTRESGQYYLAGQIYANGGAPYHLPRARAICDVAPNDPCCASCGQVTLPGCLATEADPSCAMGPNDDVSDAVNVRCFDQKRRFGIDFLYPTQRYVDALTLDTVADRDGNLVPNPLFAGGRPADLVAFAAIVGVPWQDLALDPQSIATGYRTARDVDWRLVLGAPDTGGVADDPLMRESIDPRVGQNPVTLDELAPPDATSPSANPINGHERVFVGRDDLQFACIYERAVPINCALDNCECPSNEPVPTNPLCQAPDGAYDGLQRFAGARPGLRHLDVLRQLGDRAVPASLCATDVRNSDAPAFGYKPAVDSLLRALRPHLP